MNPFRWPKYPETLEEFEALMAAIDADLASQNLPPAQRPIRVGRMLWEAFRWGGSVLPPKHLALEPGYTGEVLMAKANRWYEDTYGDQLKTDWAYGHAPVRLGNAIWRVRAGRVFGRVELFLNRDLQNRGKLMSAGRGAGPASSNVLCAVERLPQGFVSQLSDAQLREFFDFYVFMHQALQWRQTLPPTELFLTASADFDESTSAVMGRRFGQAKWAAQQSVEKTLKGLLRIAGTRFPTSGPNGHNLTHLAKLLKDHHDIPLNEAVLQLAACSSAVRYGEAETTEQQSLSANHAVLGVLDQLMRNKKVAELLAES